MAFKMKGYSPFNKGIAKDKTFEEDDQKKDNKIKNNKPVDDDTDVMTKEQKDAHRASILEYNKTTSKPLKDFQKEKIKERLSKMDPNDPEAKLLQDMLNLDKNK